MPSPVRSMVSQGLCVVQVTYTTAPAKPRFRGRGVSVAALHIARIRHLPLSHVPKNLEIYGDHGLVSKEKDG